MDIKIVWCGVFDLFSNLKNGRKLFEWFSLDVFAPITNRTNENLVFRFQTTNWEWKCVEEISIEGKYWQVVWMEFLKKKCESSELHVLVVRLKLFHDGNKPNALHWRTHQCILKKQAKRMKKKLTRKLRQLRTHRKRKKTRTVCVVCHIQRACGIQATFGSYSTTTTKNGK